MAVYFNPHSHTGSDSDKSVHKPSPRNFNPHSHTGSDFRCKDLVKMHNLYFNPHSHTGSDGCAVGVSAHATYFNPHSHTGSDYDFDTCEWTEEISIHTPTQGVTSIFYFNYPRQSYFNPHSHTGSDSSVTCLIRSLFNFNPHSHTGSDASFQCMPQI